MSPAWAQLLPWSTVCCAHVPAQRLDLALPRSSYSLLFYFELCAGPQVTATLLVNVLLKEQARRVQLGGSSSCLENPRAGTEPHALRRQHDGAALPFKDPMDHNHHEH
jgi:hypothetical protein